MRSRLHDALRWYIGICTVVLGFGLDVLHRWRRSTYRKSQDRLRARYAITKQTPISGYSPGLLKPRFVAAPRTRFAQTSGSAAEPKRIPYTRARIRRVKLTYIDAFARMYHALPIRRRSLYVFTSLTEDDSLTSLMLEERGLPPYLSTLQAPYRVHRVAAMHALVERYGSVAVRLLVLTVSNPGVIYATNPSTLSTFFDAVHFDWSGASALVRTYLNEPESFDPMVRRVVRRLESHGYRERLQRIARSDSPLTILDCLADLEAFVCWDGGYVRPFLERVRRYLPTQRFIPMYSMSTETIETVPDFSTGQTRFLPMGDGVMYELLPEELPDDPTHLRPAADAQPGEVYTMVVSDRYGLVRYQTEDLFRCERMVGDVPDLRFLGRRGLTFSFTGEKVTAQQFERTFATLREESPELAFAVVPSHPDGAALPHYKLVVLSPADPGAELVARLAKTAEENLRTLNPEYDHKRETGRLLAIEGVHMEPSAFARRMGGARHADSWETQFKFLPLYKTRWEQPEGASIPS